MKRLVMFGGADLRQIQGINLVIRQMVSGRHLFRGIELTTVYAGQQTIDVRAGEGIPVGSDTGTLRYTLRRRIRSLLRELLSSRWYPFARLKYELNYLRPARKSVRNYLRSGEKADYLLFHDMWSAYYYYRMRDGQGPERCVLVVHAVDDAMGQFFSRFPAFAGRRRARILSRRDFVYARIDHVVYLSHKACGQSCVPPQKRSVIYNGIDRMPCALPVPEGDVVRMVCVGNLSGWKGQEFIIEAFHRLERRYLRRLRLVLVGEGAQRQTLERAVRRYGLDERILFTGARKDVPEILRRQDVFIMPSQSEGLSIATLEAIRAGLFMLLTDTGGNREVMGAAGGYVIERDADDIAQKIRMLLDRQVVSADQKAATRRHFERLFTTEACIAAYERMLLSL